MKTSLSEESGDRLGSSMEPLSPQVPGAVAIVGISCRFPSAADYSAFWDNLVWGRDAIREIPPERWDIGRYWSADFEAPNRSVSKWCGLLDGVDQFDNRFFNISPREARHMDPQQRLLLEETWKCIEDSGLAPALLRRARTSVYVGVMGRDYLQETAAPGVVTDSYSAIGNYDCILANRLSYVLGLRGTSLSIDAACASSLVALHSTRGELLAGSCDFALAAGVSLNLSPWKYISFSKSRMLSPDGRCKTFDRDANGYVPGDGVGVLLLCTLERALELGCHVYGLVRGSAVNHVGQGLSITAPSVEAQSEVIRGAYRDVTFGPETVTYVEAHGTGTSLGDPIEIEALTRVFAAAGAAPHSCTVGSVKSHIGHLEAAAGVAGVIKVLLMMRHRQIPANLHLRQLNPMIDLEDSPFRLATSTRCWESAADAPLRAGVSSFGFGGVNAHALLEAYTPTPKPTPPEGDAGYLFTLSARTEGALALNLEAWRAFSASSAFADTNLHDLSATLCQGRASHPHRFALWFRDHDHLRQQLAEARPEPTPNASGWTLRFTSPHWQGHAALAPLRQGYGFGPALDRLCRYLAELPNGANLAKGFRANNWSAKRQPLYGFIVQCALFDTLLHFGFEPAQIAVTRKGLPAALVAAGLVETPMMLEYLAGCRAWHDVPFKRPLLPFRSPLTQSVWRPFQFDTTYLERLFAALAIDEESLNHYLHKARQLRESQHTFRKLFAAWGEIMRHHDRDLERWLHESPEHLLPREQILLVLVIKHCLLEVNRKWSLRLRLRIVNPAFAELLQLCQKRLLTPEDAVATLLAAQPPLARLAQSLNRQLEQLDEQDQEPFQPSFEVSAPPMEDLAQLMAAGCIPASPLEPADEPALELGASTPERLSWGLVKGAQGLRRLLLILWQRGADIDWSKLYPENSFNRLALPCYQFERHTFWLSKTGAVPAPAPLVEPPVESLPETFLSTPIWRPQLSHDLGPAFGRAVWIGTPTSLARARERFPKAQVWRSFSLVASPSAEHELDIHVPAQWTAALAALAEADGLCFFAPGEPLPLTQAQVEPQQATGILALFRLTARLLAQAPAKPLSLYAFTHRVHDLPGRSPRSADGGLSGFLRTLAKEHPRFKTACIDLDFEADDDRLPAQPEQLLDGGHPGELAWHAGQLFQRVLVPVRLEPAGPAAFRRGGVYVIAGGLGGVGMELARHLASREQAILVLLGRTPLTEARAQLVEELRSRGSQAEYLQVDLCEPTALRAALAETRRRHGQIHGVFHSAMVYNEVPLDAMELERLSEVLRPKSHGLSALAEVLGEHPPDLLVIFSSAQSFLANPNRAHYAAACTHADSFARALGHHLRCPVKIVNWGYWHVGAMADSRIQEQLGRQGIRTLRPEWAMEALRRLLASPLEQLAVLDLEPAMRAWVGIDEGHHLYIAEALEVADPSPALQAVCAVDQQQLAGFVQAYRTLGAEAESRVAAALDQAGLLNPGALQRVDPSQHRLYQQLVGPWSQHRPEPPAEAVDQAEMAPLSPLVEACIQHFSAVLEGRMPATEAVFPGGSAELVSGFYRNNRLADFCNDRVAQACLAYLRQHLASGATRKLRILELGAGTGGTSAAVFAVLAAYRDKLTYTFTDLSQTLLRQARQRFGKDDFIEYRTLDLERDLRTQGFGAGSYDLVIATNVLHATQDLRATLHETKAQLRRGGWLILNELTEVTPYTTLTFGLLAGWWLFRDERLPGGPLLDLGRWRNLLHQLGFDRICSTADHGQLPQNVIIARSDGRVLLPELALSAAPKPAPPPLVSTALPASAVAAMPAPAAPEPAAAADPAAVLTVLRPLFATVLEMPASELTGATPFAEFGVDSIASVELIERINRELQINLRATDLFNFPTLDKLAQRIASQFPQCIQQAAPTPTQALAPAAAAPTCDGEGIAVIGFSGRFPMAADVDALWHNLAAGRDCVVEIPASRWPLESFYDPDPHAPNRSYGRWAGLLEHIDHFDPLFFNLSPKEAERLDPQQRLFLEEGWRTFEHAGYGPDSLAGTNCGVFAGVEDSDYKWWESEYDAWSHAGHSTAILPARLAYALDLKGPCLTVNTACSSALVALHQACESLRGGQASMALVGGVAVLATPRLLLSLAKAGMLSPTGRCRAFDDAADGFVPAEAVCAVLLKPLAAALADRDTIHGVIRASGINYDGKTSGITAPSASSQTALVRDTYRRFRIEPNSISAIEAHGTGTALGDPIELHALTDAFNELGLRPGQRLAVGAAKAALGHTLAASGLVGLIKLLLCLKHRQLVPTPLFQRENRHIRFAESPFEVSTALTPWEVPAGQLRRAAVSAFGFSGTNAHAVVEQAPAPVSSTAPLTSYLVLLSARSATALNQQTARLQAFLHSEPPALADLAYTLAVGRGHFTFRRAFAVRSLDELSRCLALALTQPAPEPRLLRTIGGAEQLFHDLTRELRPSGLAWHDRLSALAEFYAQGADLPWWRFYRASDGRRVPLPTYPFDHASYWIAPTRAIAPAAAPQAHAAQRFDSSFSGDSFLLADHVMGGQHLLPGVVALELACRVARMVGRDACAIGQLLWLRPFVHHDRDLVVSLHLDHDAFELRDPTDEARHVVGEFLPSRPAPPDLDLRAIRARCPQSLEPYALLASFGYHYGPRMRPILEAYRGENQLFAELALPPTTPTDGFQHHPTLLDGVLQVATLAVCGELERERLFLPYSLGAAYFHRPLPPQGFVHVQALDHDPAAGLRRFRLAYCDRQGQVALTLDDYCLKEKTDRSATLHFRPSWQAQPLHTGALTGPVLLLAEDPALADRLAALINPQPLVLVQPGPRYQRSASERYQVRPGVREDFAQLLADLAADSLSPRHILTGWDLTLPAQTHLAEQLMRGPHTLIALVQALLASPARPSLTHCFDAAHPHAPAHQALAALTQAIALEAPELTCRLVAFEEKPQECDALAHALLEELREAAPSWVRRGPNDRQARVYLPLEVPETAAPDLSGNWLITGGLGGLGLLFARQVVAAGGAVLLCGRRPLAPDLQTVLRELGTRAHYLPFELGPNCAADQLIAEAHRRLGPLRGIVHAAGINDDGFLRDKQPARVDRVLAPKLWGLEALDSASRNEPLEYFIAFASTAAVLGNLGQSDYAYANAYQLAFMERRQQLVARGLRRGKSLALAWGYWQAGGMQVDAAVQADLRAQYGMTPMPTDQGLTALWAAMAADDPARVIVHGLRQPLLATFAPTTTAAPSTTGKSAQAEPAADLSATLERLVQLLAEELGLSPERIDPTEPLERYGIDSILVLSLNRRLERAFGKLSKTLLFEYQTLAELAAHLAEHAPRPVAAMPAASPSLPAQPSPSALPACRPSDIAIIGLAGRYPAAADLDQFWDNLCQGRDCIVEVPATRWASDAFAQLCRWGGFLDDVDHFDALLFQISPREAETVDPQERLFLETCWQTLENAGYTAAGLAATKVGVFVGIMYGEYQLHGAESLAAGAVTAGSSYASVANRVSYFFNFQGPSLAVDSMCSSSHTAIHLACGAIALGDCQLALAGGVNLTLHPNKYAILHQGGFTASDGRCRSFGAGGDGYVPGEGVGAVLLKSAQAALADGDQIWGLIQASTINHGGKTNGYTVPNPVAQGQLIAEALHRAELAPEAINYLEAHGTGTALGDPIEITGLGRALGHRGPVLPIGSVKSNIGHLEAAAGIAALTKVLLQLKHRTLVPSLHAHELNPHIDFAATRLRVQRELAPWPAPTSGARRAGISSFGAGGANGHLIVAEAPVLAPRPAIHGPHLIVVSARSAAALRAHAADLAASLNPHGQTAAALDLPALVNLVAAQLDLPAAEIPTDERLEDLGFDTPSLALLAQRLAEPLGAEPALEDLVLAPSLAALAAQWAAPSTAIDAPRLADLAFTLQLGRQPFAHRLALVCADLPTLVQGLQAFAAEQPSPAAYAQALPREQLPLHGSDLRERALDHARAGRLDQLAALWLQGHDLDWAALQPLLHPASAPAPRRLALPGRPFERRRYWLPRPAATTQAAPLASVQAVPTAAPPSGESLLLVPRFRPQPGTDQTLPGGVLLFDRDPSLFTQLRQLRPAILVTPGDGFAQEGDHYRLNPCDEHQFARLFAALAERGFQFDYLWLAWFAPAAPQPDQDLGLHSVLALTRQLPAVLNPRLALIHRDGAAAPSPAQAALAALAETIRAERPSRCWASFAISDVEPGRALPRLLADAPADCRLVRLEPSGRSALSWQLAPAAAALALPTGLTWLVSGGLGGVGYHLAHWLARQGARLHLCGRSPLDHAGENRLAQLRALGAGVLYSQADVTVEADCARLVALTHQRFGPVHGVLHAAGLVADALLAHKDRAHCAPVLAVKIDGALALDRATAADAPRYFVACSSLSAVAGTAGQVDYAYANAWLDAYLSLRRRQTGRHYQSLAWPLWQDGGMHVPEPVLRLLFQTKGLRPLPTPAALDLFARALATPEGHLLAVHGDRARLLDLLHVKETAMSLTPNAPSDPPRPLLAELSAIVAGILRLKLDDVDPHLDLGAFGFESLTFTEFASALNERFHLSLTPVQLYEHRNLVELARELQRLGAAAPAAHQPAPPPVTLPVAVAPVTRPAAVAPVLAPPSAAAPIAILGMAGSLPGSPDLDRFWQHLRDGRDLVGEIPADRWDWRAYHGDPHQRPGTTPSHWGGFLDQIYLFDADFFGISPREALAMDPQQRLFLQTAWHALEDAAIAPSSLAGSETGVFVGCSGSDFADSLRADQLEAHDATGSHRALLPNRISYLLDLHGPSEVIDSACSSSLLAVHRAVAALRAGECALAIAGGVQLILDPRPYLIAASADMLSPSGRCRTFDAAADGYVKGEGVGAVVLRPLDQALAAGDPVLAVIRGSAVNHGGRARSLTVPNPNAQAELIVRAWRQAGVDPATITYLETHGTGTHLGDPIELRAIRKAFATLEPALANCTEPFCGLGAVKSNIGHLEGAAGIAGLLKVLLAMRHQTLPKSLHIENVNPYLELEGSPFYLVRDARPWQRLRGPAGELPRRAGISSFGFGGVNVHLALEQAPEPEVSAASNTPELVLLSARNPERLRAGAERLIRWLETTGQQAALADIAVTSQLGRDPMAQRLALIATSREQLLDALRLFLAGETSVACFHGAAAPANDPLRALLDGESGAVFVGHLLDHRQLAKLAQIWTARLAEIDWRQLARAVPARRIALPTYNFAETEYRRAARPNASTTTAKTTAPKPSSSLPVERVGHGHFQALPAATPFLAEHRVAGQFVLPGVAYLELARAAAAEQQQRPITGLAEILWSQPCTDPQQALTIQLDEQAQRFTIEGHVRHAEGRFEDTPNPAAPRLDLAAVRARVQRRLERSELYASFRAMGIDYGPSFQVLEYLDLAGDEVLGSLVLPADHDPAAGLHPLLLDAMLHAGIGLRDPEQLAGQQTIIPFSLERCRIYGPLPNQALVHMRLTSASRRGGQALRRYDLALCDHQGNVLLALEGLVTRAVANDQAEAPLHLYRPTWRTLPAAPTPTADRPLWLHAPAELVEAWSQLGHRRTSAIATAPGLDLLDPAACFAFATDQAQRGHLPEQLVLDLTAAEWQAPESALRAVHHLCRALVKPSAGKLLEFRVLVPAHSVAAAALAAFGRCLVREHESYRFAVLECAAELTATERAARLRQELALPCAGHMRLSATQRRMAAHERLTDTVPAAALPLPQGLTCLISGGAGGLGLGLARHLAEHHRARLALLGRSPETPAIRAELDSLRRLGGEALYLRADVADPQAVAAAVSACKTRFGAIQAVFHCAGVLRDQLFLADDADFFAPVLAPKWQGARVLDQATATEPLLAFVAFGSAAAELGNLGQSAYAAANAALTHTVAARAEQVARGERQGISRTLAWPLWQDGGMTTASERRTEQAEQGLQSMTWTPALRALNQALSGADPTLLPLCGDRQRIEQAFALGAVAQSQSHTPAAPAPREPEPDLEAWLVARLREAVGNPELKPEPDRSFAEYGVDSFISIRLLKQLEGRFGNLRKTLLFEHDTLADLCAYLRANHPGSAPIEASLTVQAAIPPQAPASPAASPTAAAADQTVLSAWLVARLREAVGNPELNPEPDRSFADYGVDSFISIRLLKQLEGRFGSLRKTLLFEHDTLADLCAYLHANHTAAAPPAPTADAPAAATSPLPEPPLASAAGPAPQPTAAPDELSTWLLARLREAVGNPDLEPDPDRAFSEYGVDSFISIRLLKQLESRFGSLRKTLLFEHDTLADLTAFLQPLAAAASVPEVSPLAAPHLSPLNQELEPWLTETVAQALDVESKSIWRDAPFHTYGVESFVNLRILVALEKRFGPLPKTLLFEHDTLAALAAHLEQVVAVNTFN